MTVGNNALNNWKIREENHEHPSGHPGEKRLDYWTMGTMPASSDCTMPGTPGPISTEIKCNEK